MRAIKLRVIGVERVNLERFVEDMNEDDDVAAILISKDTAFLAVAGYYGSAYVRYMASRHFTEYEIENIK